jgi:uncharacterized protein YqgV (UPF0045/DUF77 family)
MRPLLIGYVLTYMATSLQAMTVGHLEILVEPFKENDPGPHVEAVLGVLKNAGLSADMGPFSTFVEGEIEVLLGVVQKLLTAGFEAGADRISTTLERHGR